MTYLRFEQINAVNVDSIASGGNDAIDYELPFSSVFCMQQKRNTAGFLAGCHDRRAGMDRHKILHSLAKPPCTLGREMLLHEAGA